MVIVTTQHRNRVGLIAWITWYLLMLGTAVFGQTLPTSFDYTKRAKDGRLYQLPVRSKDTLWIRVRADGHVVSEPALKPWPYKLGVKLDFSENRDRFNAQGQPDVKGTKWRYRLDGGKWREEPFWEHPIEPGQHRIEVEFTRAGYPVETISETFVVPPRKPVGGGGAIVLPNPKPDSPPPANRLDGPYLTDAVLFPAQPGNLRYVPRILLSKPSRTNDPDLTQLPPFTLSKWFTIIYGDLGDETLLRQRGVNVFQRLNQPGDQTAVLIGRNILEPDPGKGTPGTRWAEGIADHTEAQELRSRVRNYLGGQVTSDGKTPKLIAFDYERDVADKSKWNLFEALRRQMFDEARERYPASQVGTFQDSHVDEGVVGRVKFESGGYVILNLFVPQLDRYIDACERPELWRTAYTVYGEWVFERLMEGRKALQWRRQDGKELIVSFWNLIKDGCQVPDHMTHRPDVAEGQVLAGLMSGPKMLWLWNAHPCTTPSCLPEGQFKGQNLNGTLHALAALQRLSALNDLFDGNQTYFLPEVSRDGLNYVPQPERFEGHNRPAAYAPLYNMGADLWAYQWPDNLPTVLGVRNGAKVGIYAVLPRQINSLARQQFWIRTDGFRDTFILQGRENALFKNY